MVPKQEYHPKGPKGFQRVNVGNKLYIPLNIKELGVWEFLYQIIYNISNVIYLNPMKYLTSCSLNNYLSWGAMSKKYVIVFLGYENTRWFISGFCIWRNQCYYSCSFPYHRNTQKEHNNLLFWG